LSREEAESIAKPFLQVFLDSANYGFSVNHSEAYSWMGYACAWLRYYYPIEFITASLNINIGKEEKTAKLIEYAKLRGISVNPIKFRYSKSGYSFDKNSNAIYQGIKPIKFLNSQAADDLYKLKNNNYNTFTELLIDISQNTHVNYKQLKILTQLNFFQEFGKNNKLLLVIEMYEKKLKNSKLKEDTKQKRKIEVEEYEKTLDDKSIGLKDQIKAEVEYYGYEVTTLNKLPKGVYSLTEIDTKYTPRLRLYHLKDGSILELKCKKSIMEQNKLEKFNIIKVNSIIKQNKKKLIDGRWVEIDEKELFLVSWDTLK
jgi:DNA polymerase-3 subunit alpha